MADKPDQGDIVPVLTTEQSEYVPTSVASAAPADDSIYRKRVVRLTSDVDVFYRLDGIDATLVAPTTKLLAGVERNEFVPDTITGGIRAILASGTGTLQIDLVD